MKLIKRLSTRSKSSKGSQKVSKAASVPEVKAEATANNGENQTIKTSVQSDASLSSDDDQCSFKLSGATVEGRTVVAKVEKPDQSTKVGLSLTKDEETNSILIAAVAEGGLFAASELRAGQKIQSINGTTCPKEVTEAARLITETRGTITIEACDLVKADADSEGPDGTAESGIDEENSRELPSDGGASEEADSIEQSQSYFSLSTVAVVVGAVSIAAGTLAHASLSGQ